MYEFHTYYECMYNVCTKYVCTNIIFQTEKCNVSYAQSMCPADILFEKN
jgi:hypothetical protein